MKKSAHIQLLFVNSLVLSAVACDNAQPTVDPCNPGSSRKRPRQDEAARQVEPQVAAGRSQSVGQTSVGSADVADRDALPGQPCGRDSGGEDQCAIGSALGLE